MATCSSTLAQRIPWTEEPGGLQSMGSQESDTTDSSLQHLITSGRLFIFAFGGSCLSWSPATPLSTSVIPPPVPSVHFTMNLTVLRDDAAVLFSTDSLRGLNTDSLRGLNNNYRNNYSLSMSCVPGPFQSTLRALLLPVSLSGSLRRILLSPHLERKK